MKRIYEALQKSDVFVGIAYEDFESVLQCLSARTACYQKGEIIMLNGDDVTSVGMIVSGSIKIVKEDERGNISMLTELSESEMYGEILTFAEIEHSPVTIYAAKDTEILHIDHHKIISPCATPCPFHAKLIENMLRHIARRNFMLNRKIEILSKRTTKEKLLCFFDLYSHGSGTFTVPFNREEMAQYLCVDRSAMSNELCKMRDEGLLRFQKNQFEVFY